jgi:hypothetical protein
MVGGPYCTSYVFGEESEWAPGGQLPISLGGGWTSDSGKENIYPSDRN